MITEILQLLQLQDLTFLHRTRYRTKHLFWIAAANTPLRGNGKKRVPKLGQHHSKQRHLVLRQLTGNGIGRSGDGRC